MRPRVPVNPLNVLLRATFALFCALLLAIPLAFLGVSIYLVLADETIPLEVSPTTSRWEIGLAEEAEGSGAYEDLVQDLQSESPEARFHLVQREGSHYLVVYARAGNDAAFRDAQQRARGRNLSTEIITLPSPIDFLQPTALESFFAWLSENPGAILGALSSQGVSFALIGGFLFLSCRRKGIGWAAEPPPMMERILYGIGGGFALVALASLIEATHVAIGSPVVEQAWVGALRSGDPGGRLALWIAVALVAPIGEELFFRGYLFQSLDVRVGTVVAYVVSIVAFAGVHANPSAVTVYVALGVGLAWLHFRMKSLVAPILAHIVVNAAGLWFG